MLERSIDFKNKTLLIVFLLTVAFIFTFAMLIYTAQEINNENTNKNFEKTLHSSIDETVNSMIDTYSILADTVLETTKAKELMKAEKREELYELLESKWSTWTTINPDFKIMLFHRADGTAFLRMHKPEKYDDYLSGIRPMVKSVHKEQKTLIGYETGKYSTVFRILTPIFYNGEYLGALDFGINPNYFIKQIRKYASQEGVLFIKEENLKLFKRESSFKINDYILQTKTNTYIHNILNKLPSNYNLNNDKIVNIDDTTYIVHTYRMNDYNDKEKAKLLFFYDITETLKSQKEFTIMLGVASIIFIIIMFILLNYSFNKLLFSLKDMHEKHSKELIKKDKLLHRQSKLAAMGEMISMIAHQWRQPLGALSSIAINLQVKMQLEIFDLTKKEGREEFEKYFNKSLDEINSLVQNMTATIDDFRNFYKPNKILNHHSCNIPIKKAINIIKSSLNSDGVELVEEYLTEKEIDMYSNELMQVVLNILKNAQDNFKEKNIKDPKITIMSTDNNNDEGGVLIHICDNGGGIPEDITENIFDPYFSTKDEKNGTGLGLYMSKVIIETHHNGVLKAINSENGACFVIELHATPES